ncbi:MAG TPA: GAF domain-containing protein [Chloroflexia bacterium]|nr:GAF domain-containing protein [Chloroflexia bacterium]
MTADLNSKEEQDRTSMSSDVGAGKVPAALDGLPKGDRKALLKWARGVGERSAREDRGIAPLVERIMSAAGTSGSEDGVDADELAPLLVAAAVEAYEEHGSHSGRDAMGDLMALHRVISAANSSLKLNDMLKEIVQAVVEVTHADICSIFLYEPEWDQLVLTATSGLNTDRVGDIRLRLGEGITGWAALVGKPVAVKEAWSDTRFKYVPGLLEENTVSILAVPIVLFTKEKLVGVIDVHMFEESEFSDAEVKFLETVAGEIAIAIENARLYQQTDIQLRQKVQELSTLQGVSAHIASTLNLTEVLSLIARQAAQLVRADAAAIYELHDEAGVLELVAQYDLNKPVHGVYHWRGEPRVVVPIDKSAIAHAVIRGVPGGLPADSDSALGVPFAGEEYHSLFVVPLVAPRGIMGGICLYNIEEKNFEEDQVRLLDAFAREAAIAVENARLYDAALRGLQTKSAMLQEMNHRVRNNLQTVAGLLSMQLRRIPAESDGAAALKESISRVQSIAAVHDLMMSGDGEVESIRLYELARKIADGVVSTLIKPGFKLSLNIEPATAEGIRVNSHEATMLALLFNELISNAILHGFAGLNSGSIDIRVKLDSPAEEGAGQRRGQSVTIEVIDSGVGLPPGFDPVKGGNLGLNIVHTLVVSDMRGTFSIGPGVKGKGTRAVFSFVPHG